MKSSIYYNLKQIVFIYIKTNAFQRYYLLIVTVIINLRSKLNSKFKHFLNTILNPYRGVS